ncbi:MAG: response regulator [Mariprofundales bacterium]
MKTMLVVDDNTTIREMLPSMAELWAEDKGFSLQVIEMEDGSVALEWVKAHGKPDFLLLDVRMPKMNGAEFLRRVDALGFDFHSCTLLLTGYADDLEDQLGSDAMVIDHLRKPFLIPELFSALDALLKSSEA